MKKVAISTSKEFYNNWLEVTVSGDESYSYCAIGQETFKGKAVSVKGSFVAHGYEHIMSNDAYNKQRVAVLPLGGNKPVSETVSPWVKVEEKDGSYRLAQGEYETVTPTLVSKLLEAQKELGVGCKIYFHRKVKKHVLEGETYLNYSSGIVKVEVGYDHKKDVQTVKVLASEVQAPSPEELQELLSSKLSKVVDSM